MKVWISRNKGKALQGNIVVSTIRPGTPTHCKKDTYCHYEENVLLDLTVRAFKNQFGYIILPGTCVKGDIDVKPYAPTNLDRIKIIEKMTMNISTDELKNYFLVKY